MQAFRKEDLGIMIYTVTLSNGNKLEGLRASGSYFVSGSEVTEEMFSGGLTLVKVSAVRSKGEDANMGVLGYDSPCELGEHRNMELGDMFKSGGEWYFMLKEPDAEELEKLKVQADIEYLAMMTGVTL